MNPVIATLLTVLQWAGYLIVFTYIVMLLTYAACKIVHAYWSGKTACLKMTNGNAPDVASMYRAAMDARNGKQTETVER